jgi:DNA-binding IclR family transcriptional regulator
LLSHSPFGGWRRIVAAISAAGRAFRITGDNLERLMSRVPKLAAGYSKRLGYVPSLADY